MDWDSIECGVPPIPESVEQEAVHSITERAFFCSFENKTNYIFFKLKQVLVLYLEGRNLICTNAHVLW